MQQPMPELLILSEEGYWEQPTWSRDPDDEVFIETGWQVRTYSGVVMFRHNAERPVLNWLTNNGYVDTGDGAHFRHKDFFSEGKSAPVLVDFSDGIEQFIQERFKALQREVKQD